MAPALNPKPPMSVRLPDELKERLEAHAEAAGITPHAAAVAAIAAWIAARDQDAALAGWRAQREQEISR